MSRKHDRRQRQARRLKRRVRMLEDAVAEIGAVLSHICEVTRRLQARDPLRWN